MSEMVTSSSSGSSRWGGSGGGDGSVGGRKRNTVARTVAVAALSSKSPLALGDFLHRLPGGTETEQGLPSQVAKALQSSF